MIIYNSSKNRQTSEGWYPVKSQFSPYTISAMHLACLDSGLRQNDEV